ncbi:MAG: lysylphosphatidylglycerol synthase transmembrane domain-containing protein [Candidatus Hydrothermales bacterium]
MNKKFLILLKIFFTIFLLGVIFYRIDINELLKLYKRINFKYLVPAILAYYFAFLFLSLRWKFLLLEHSSKVRLSEIFKVYLLGMLINTVSPSTLGVDVLRGYLIEKKIKSGKSFAFASVLIDRIVGLFGIFSFAPFGLLFIKGIPNSHILLLFCIFISFSIISLLFVTQSHFFEVNFKKLIKSVPLLGINKKIENFYNSYKTYSKYKKLLFFSFILTIFLQVFFSIQAYYCARTLSFNISPFVFIFIIPLINALNLIPLTISGLGVREAGFYILFSKYFSPESSVSISLLYFLSGVIANLPFGIYLFKSPFKSEKRPKNYL